MRDRFGVAFVAALLLATLQASAAETWHTSRIRWVYPQADGQTFVLVFQENAPSCPSASTPKYQYVAVGQNGVTAEGLKQLLSVSLSAAAQGLTVQVAFDNATGACYVNRLLVIYP
jgi:hypothetical protein